MRVPTRPRQPGIRFNITPLIDIVFLLIVFFLAATHLTQNEKLEAVELPEASQNESEPDEAPWMKNCTCAAMKSAWKNWKHNFCRWTKTNDRKWKSGSAATAASRIESLNPY